MGRTVIIGQGYVGLPLAMRAVEVGLRRRRLRRRRAAGSSASPPASPSSRTSPADRLAAGPWTPAGYHPQPTTTPTRPASTSPSITVPTPLRDGVPDLQLHRGSRRRSSARYLRPGRTRRPRVHHLPGHHRGAARARSWRTARASRRRRLPPRLQPRAHRPGQPDLAASDNTPKVVSGIDAASLGRVAGASTSASSTRPCPCRAPKEAELTKLLENTFRHVNIALVNELAMFARRPRHRRVGGDRRRVDQAVRLHARSPRAPASAATACRSTPRYLSWRVKRALGPELPVRRAGQRRQRAHARLRRPPAHRGRSTTGAGRSTAAGSCCSGWRTRRTPATPGSRPARAIAELLARLGRRGARPPTRTSSSAHRSTPAGRRRRADRRARCAAADAVVLLTDHDAFDYDMVDAARHATSSTPGPAATATPSSASSPSSEAASRPSGNLAR